MFRIFRKISQWLRPDPKTPEELAARLEAERLQAEIKAMRLGRGRRR
jgi:hypothetical protein